MADHHAVSTIFLNAPNKSLSIFRGQKCARPDGCTVALAIAGVGGAVFVSDSLSSDDISDSSAFVAALLCFGEVDLHTQPTKSTYMSMPELQARYDVYLICMHACIFIYPSAIIFIWPKIIP